MAEQFNAVSLSVLRPYIEAICECAFACASREVGKVKRIARRAIRRANRKAARAYRQAHEANARARDMEVQRDHERDSKAINRCPNPECGDSECECCRCGFRYPRAG